MRSTYVSWMPVYLKDEPWRQDQEKKNVSKSDEPRVIGQMIDADEDVQTKHSGIECAAVDMFYCLYTLANLNADESPAKSIARWIAALHIVIQISCWVMSPLRSKRFHCCRTVREKFSI